MLTSGVKTPIKYGPIIPVTAPEPFIIAMIVPAKLGLKSKLLIFVPGYDVPIKAIAAVKRTTAAVLLHPA